MEYLKFIRLKRLSFALQLALILTFSFFSGCNKEDSYNGIAWDESIDGELSGNMKFPTIIKLELGNNRIIGSSTPSTGAQCTTFEGGPPVPIIPFFPNHESYTDLFSFTLPSNHRISNIIVESLEIEPIHAFEDFPCVGELNSQLGAFTAINNSNQIDWNSDNVINFISMPSEHPLIGAGFAKNVGDDLLSKYRDNFPLDGYEINSPGLEINNGTYTFWWKEGANQANYTLNFIVEEFSN